MASEAAFVRAGFFLLVRQLLMAGLAVCMIGLLETDHLPFALSGVMAVRASCRFRPGDPNIDVLFIFVVALPAGNFVVFGVLQVAEGDGSSSFRLVGR